MQSVTDLFPQINVLADVYFFVTCIASLLCFCGFALALLIALLQVSYMSLSHVHRSAGFVACLMCL